MFSCLSVSSNGKPATLHESKYHYTTHLEKLLNYGCDASGSHLLSIFWFLDYPSGNGTLKDNTGYATRLKYFGNSKTIDLYGRLHTGMFNSDNILTDGLDMNIRLRVHRKLSIF
jgi:hypothetical protein